MADIKYYDVILKPVVTEKSMSIMADRKYTFLVNPEANKSQVKEAVEKMFDEVKVKSVNIMNIQGKNKRQSMAQRYGKTSRSLKDSDVREVLRNGQRNRAALTTALT